ALLTFGHVENHDMRVQLGRCITVHRPGAVMFKCCGNPIAGGLGRMIPTNARLYKPLGLVEGDANAGSMRGDYPAVAAHKRRERYALRSRERRIPTSAMVHRVDDVAS